jgi:hypothetical protein
VPLDSIIKDPSSPSEDVIGNGRRTSLKDLLQHIINMIGANVLYSQVAYVWIYIFFDSAAQYVGVLPAFKYLAFKIFAG